MGGCDRKAGKSRKRFRARRSPPLGLKFLCGLQRARSGPAGRGAPQLHPAARTVMCAKMSGAADASAGQVPDQWGTMSLSSQSSVQDVQEQYDTL